VTRGAALSALRHLCAMITAGVVGGVVWLVVMQEGPERDWSDHDFNQIMGQLVVGREDDVARAGFLVTMPAAIVLAALYALIEGRTGRSGLRLPLVFSLAPFLLWGLVLSPGVTAYKDTALDVARQEIPGGFFGTESGVVAVILAAVASVLFGLAASRVYRLMRTPEWWRSRGDTHSVGTLDAIIAPKGSLELSEQRPEEGREGAGR
jgi:hypothetical protein